MSWTREKIERKIQKAAERWRGLNPQQFDQLQFVLERTDSVTVFNALYSVCCDPTRPATRSTEQEYAGRLLLAVSPPCHKPLPVAIRGLLATFDPSVEQIPFYFAEKFGRSAVLETLDGLLVEDLSDRERGNLRTFGYWLGGQHWQKSRRL